MWDLAIINRMNEEAAAKGKAKREAAKQKQTETFPADDGSRIAPHGDPLARPIRTYRTNVDAEVVDMDGTTTLREARDRGHKLERLEEAAREVLKAGSVAEAVEALAHLQDVLNGDD